MLAHSVSTDPKDSRALRTKKRLVEGLDFPDTAKAAEYLEEIRTEAGSDSVLERADLKPVADASTLQQ